MQHLDGSVHQNMSIMLGEVLDCSFLRLQCRRTKEDHRFLGKEVILKRRMTKTNYPFKRVNLSLIYNLHLAVKVLLWPVWSISNKNRTYPWV